MKFLLVALSSAIATLVCATPTSNHVLHERRDVPLKSWEKRDRVDPGQLLPMRIGMTQSNLDQGYDLLMEVSQHDSPHYGKHYTAEEVHDIFAPSEKTVASVREWLESAGIDPKYIKQSVNKQWMQVDISAKKAGELLKTDYHFFEHETGKHTIGCDEYHLPDHVREHVDYITPGIVLVTDGKKDPEASKEKRGFFNGEAKNPFPILPPTPFPGGIGALQGLIDQGLLNFCDTVITPPCIAQMYNITQATKAHKGNELGIFEITDFYNEEDLLLFFTTLAQNIPPTTMPILHGIDGGFAPLVAMGESNLDFQISYPIIYPQNSILFQSDDLNYELNYEFRGLFNNFLSAIDGSYCHSVKGLDPQYPDPTPVTGYNHKLQCGVYKPTNVISVSYGEQEDQLPARYQIRQCHEFMKLGMQGTSIVFASGDSGVAARTTTEGNANGCQGPDGKIFNPDFPASCPYLTTTGSVFLPQGAQAGKDEEVATTSFPSGGGFSNIYNRPAYQNKNVKHYFNTAVPDYPYYFSHHNDSYGENGGIYNRNGRGYPDVSAIGDNVLIFLDGAPITIGGTSAAAPVFAAVLNRINEERLSAGKSTVGFVNPVLYAHPAVLHDITKGSNPGCGTNGFVAAKGWDPVTGLGTPNYPEMLKLFMSMP